MVASYPATTQTSILKAVETVLEEIVREAPVPESSVHLRFCHHIAEDGVEICLNGLDHTHDVNICEIAVFVVPSVIHILRAENAQLIKYLIAGIMQFFLKRLSVADVEDLVVFVASCRASEVVGIYEDFDNRLLVIRTFVRQFVIVVSFLIIQPLRHPHIQSHVGGRAGLNVYFTSPSRAINKNLQNNLYI